MKKPSSNILMFASSETDANLYHACRFLAPDPFIFIQTRLKKYLLISDLEIDRARSEAKVHRLLSLSELSKHYKNRHGKKPNEIDLIKDFAEAHGIRSFDVPGNFPVRYADLLRRQGIKLRPKTGPFFPDRTVKTKEERRAISQTLRHVEKAAALAIQKLKASVIQRGKLCAGRSLLTSEAIKRIINLSLTEDGCSAAYTIVSCGKQSVNPHEEGKGPLYAHQPIIIDIFPRNLKNRYYADFTRTVVRGKASDKLKKMYAAVKEAQCIAFRSIRGGADGSRIHRTIQKHFEESGFPTGTIGGRKQGFFHGTGHGLGLEIHEEPSLGPKPCALKTGQILTVEPGLYYQDTGGIRLEDLVVVTKTGCSNLTRFPKKLEI